MSFYTCIPRSVWYVLCMERNTNTGDTMTDCFIRTVGNIMTVTDYNKRSQVRCTACADECGPGGVRYSGTQNSIDSTDTTNVWVCQLCGEITPRQTRVRKPSAKRLEQNAMLDALLAEVAAAN